MQKLLEWFLSLFSRESKSQSQIIEEDPMKYLIAGLGNVGSKYDDTRHNVGFEVLDHLAESKCAEWKSEKLAFVTEIKHKGRTLILIKPTTFMNLSGKSVNYWMQQHKIKRENLLVVLDDLNLDFGLLRIKQKGSDGGHNGLKDIDRVLQGNNYARLRFGIGDNFRKGQQVDFVLGKWSKEERDTLPELIEKAGKGVLSFASVGMKYTMEFVNQKPKKKGN